MVESFAVGLRALMRRRHLSAPKLAARLDCSAKAIYTYTSGSVVPSHLVAVGMATLLKWPDAVKIAKRDRELRSCRTGGPQADAAVAGSTEALRA